MDLDRIEKQMADLMKFKPMLEELQRAYEASKATEVDVDPQARLDAEEAYRAEQAQKDADEKAAADKAAAEVAAADEQRRKDAEAAQAEADKVAAEQAAKLAAEEQAARDETNRRLAAETGTPFKEPGDAPKE